MEITSKAFPLLCIRLRVTSFQKKRWALNSHFVNTLDLFITWEKNYKKTEAFHMSYIYKIHPPLFFPVAIHKMHTMPLAYQQSKWEHCCGPDKHLGGGLASEQLVSKT